jgi:hypothetical protein
MIEVQGPDGSSFEFPDGMAHGDIEAALQRHYGLAPSAVQGPPGKTAINEKGERLGLTNGLWLPPVPEGFVVEDPPLPKGYKLEATPSHTFFAKSATNAKGERLGLFGGQWTPPPPNGFIPEDPPLPPGFKLEVGTGEDLARSAVSGLATGAAGIPGAPGDAQALLKSHNPFDWLADKYKAFDPKQAAKNEALAGKMGRTSDLGPPIDFPTTEEIKAKTGLSATDYTPRTEGGRITKGIATMVPGALTGGARTAGGLAADLGRYAVAPALAVEGVDKLDVPEPYKGPAKMLASITASVLAKKAISPNASHAPEASREAYAGQVARLEQEGIPVSAGERADSRGLRVAEDELDPEAYKAKNEAVTRAATRTVPGFETPVIDHGAGGTIDTMLSTTGRRFDTLSARNTLVPDAGMAVDVMNLRQHFTRNPNLFDAGVVKAVEGEADALRDALHTNAAGGQPFLTGAQYQRLRSSVNTAARTTENPQKAQALHVALKDI